jgi:hypothetical protein
MITSKILKKAWHLWVLCMNDKFWEGLIHLLSLYKLAVNSLVAMVTMEQ